MVNTSNAADPEYKIKESYPVPDPDLEIRVVGGGGGGHPDPEIRGGAVSNQIFSALRASVWSKNRGAGPSPRFATINGGRLAFVADVI